MQLTFTRGDELGREQRTIPAALYNKIRLLFAHRNGEALFVPIRSMQYLAVVDDQEIVFVDGQLPRAIEIAWCDFKAGQRINLHDPVAYTSVFYDEKGRDMMNRLQSEFHKAVGEMDSRQPRPESATVTRLERP